MRSWAKSLPGKNRDARPTTKSSSLTAPGWQWKTPWPRRRCMKKLGQRASELTFNSQPDMKWITREKIKVDRVACPWLIKKFVDPEAEFVFLPHDTDWAESDNVWHSRFRIVSSRRHFAQPDSRSGHGLYFGTQCRSRP